MKRSTTLPAFALLALLATGACERADAPLAPEGPVAVAPQFGHNSSSSSQPVWGDDGSGYAEAVIGPEGGRLVAGEHSLTIPAGAVSGDTRFTMTLTGETTISVELSATAVGSSVRNDVGAAGFPHALHLDLSYDRARGHVLNRLHIAFMAADGSLYAVPSHVYRAQKFVRGSIDHFSGYIVAD